VHRGHQAILAAARRRADAAGTQRVAVIFEPHPSAILTPDRIPPILTPLHEKMRLLEQSGVDALILVQTTREFLNISAEDFLRDIIVGRFHPIAVVEGISFGFGLHRQGDANMLRDAGRTHGFEVEIVEPVRVALGGHPDTVISSSLVRHLLNSGTVDGTALCLGRPYALFGRVIHGAGRGHNLGFPTANLEVEPQLIPAEGVYAGRAFLLNSNDPRGQTPIAAAISIGRNPTFNETALSVEAYLLDFVGDLYAALMRLEFLEWLRPQQKFDSVPVLAEQIDRDVQRTREIIATHKDKEMA